MSRYLRTDDLYTEIMTRIDAHPSQILLAYYDIHIHPKTAKNFAWSILRALITERATGADVRLLLPAFRYNKANRRSAFYLEAAGILVRIMPEHMPLHTKMIIFEKTALILGSHNLSRPAFSRNLETSAVLTAPADVLAGREDFFKWWRVAVPLKREATRA